MFRFFILSSLFLIQVFCQTTEEVLELNTDFITTPSWQQNETAQNEEFNTDFMTTQSWQQEFNISNDTTQSGEQEFNTNYDTTQSWQQDFNISNDTTQSWEQEFNTNYDTTQSQEQTNTEEPLQVDSTNDFTQIQQITSTIGTAISNVLCPSSITPEMLEETKKEIINTILQALSNNITSRLDSLEAHLSSLTSLNNGPLPNVELSWQIYENLQIPLNGWLRVFHQPYNHKTRTADLDQLSGICHNQILVAATINGSISLAAVGPASILTINTTWNQPQQFGQVYWYRTNGKSFGFSPTITIRQTSGDNEDLNSSLRLSWLLDQNMGGYRAGATRSLADNLLWYKTVYCN